MSTGIIALIAILALLAVITPARSVTVIHQAEKGLVERFGQQHSH
jgi:regulator of protease activity HflC (stomatin/prohibitin superfamily)